jgi:hypothetical protein
MTFDPSSAVASTLEEHPDAVEMILDETEHEDDARQFLLEKSEEALSGNISTTTTRCELKTQLREYNQ